MKDFSCTPISLAIHTDRKRSNLIQSGSDHVSRHMYSQLQFCVYSEHDVSFARTNSLVFLQAYTCYGITGLAPLLERLGNSKPLQPDIKVQKAHCNRHVNLPV